MSTYSFFKFKPSSDLMARSCVVESFSEYFFSCRDISEEGIRSAIIGVFTDNLGKERGEADTEYYVIDDSAGPVIWASSAVDINHPLVVDLPRLVAMAQKELDDLKAANEAALKKEAEAEAEERNEREFAQYEKLKLKFDKEPDGSK